jgi:uncharacterized protein
MKTKFNLKKYEDLYDTFDEGHDKTHLEEVRTNALKLGKIYAPQKLEIIYIAATLHDVGISISREDHERHSYEIVEKDLKIKDAYSKEDFELILEAVREHRASNGNPKSTVAKIIADADRTPRSTGRALKRSYDYNRVISPELSHKELLKEVANHIYNKFGPEGYGKKLFFEETRKIHKEVFDEICREIEKGNLKAVEEEINSIS